MGTDNDRQGTVGSRLRRDTDSCIVSYRNVETGVYADAIGHGSTFNDRVDDADSRLPRGEWLRTCISTPNSIYGDLLGRIGPDALANEWRGSAYVKHERRTVVIA